MALMKMSESWVSGLLLFLLTVFVHDIEFCDAQSQNRMTVKDWIQSRTRTPTPARSIRPIGSTSSAGGAGGGPIVSINPQVDTRLKQGLFRVDPDAYKSPLEMIAKYGYKGESHLVVTPDGYILTVVRLMPNTTSDKFRGPIFLQHGLVSSCMEFFVNTKENMLPFALSDEGYDVWFGNSRGSTYSRGHVSISNTDPAYWEFSVNEMGKYDLPSQIDLVLAKTGHEKVSYIGQSMGPTQFWIRMSHHPHMNDKVKVMIAFAPVVYLKHSTTMLRLFTHLEGIRGARDWVINFSQGQFLPFALNPLVNLFTSVFCAQPPPFQTLCSVMVQFSTGYSKQTDVVAQAKQLSQLPAPTSFRSMAHIVQFIKPSLFREYDFGSPGKNMKVYGRKTPPPYDLKKTTTPCALFYGKTDQFVNPIDVERLAKELPNVILHSAVESDAFNHLDFDVAKDIKVLVNDRVLKILEHY